MKLRQLEPSVAVRGLHHRDLRPDALEPYHAVHPTALDRPLALQLESELDEERRRGREVVEPIGWWERAARWSEETSDGLLGSIGS